MTTTYAPEGRTQTVKLELEVEVPTSADQADVLRQLTAAAYHRQGVTITMPKGDKVDVDLHLVREVIR